MTDILQGLTAALEGFLPLALAAAFAWGVLSILISPCHLASLPLIVAFIQGQGAMTRGRALGLSSLFALGILVTIALLGVISAAAGRLLGDVGSLGNLLVAVIFIAVGLVFLDVLPAEFSGPGQVALRRKGAWAALVLGLVFGLALGPCTFAFLAPVLAAGFNVARGDALQGVLLVAAYGLGHCLVIALFGGSAAWVQRTLDWNASSAAGRRLRRTCGALVILAGFYLLYTAP
jgi:cytochrome c-type biogenesis protein